MSLRRSLLPLVTFLAACSSYQGTMSVGKLPDPIEPSSRYEFWSHGTGHQLHAVRVVGDSVIGVPWWKDPGCDSCRVALARAEVDSVRTPKFDAAATGATASLVIPFVVIPTLTIIAMIVLGMGPTD